MKAMQGALAAAPFVLVTSAVLILPASLLGHAGWPAGWAVVALVAAVAMGGSGWLAARRPRSFKVRRQGVVAAREKKQPIIDAVGSVAFFAYLISWFATVWIANFYMSLYNRLRLDIKHENVTIAVEQTALGEGATPPGR